MTTLLLFGDTERSPALRHEIPISIIDPLLLVQSDSQTTVLTSWLERERIAAVRPDAEILEFFALGLKELIDAGRPRAEAEREVVLRAVERLGVSDAIVPGDFPVAVADRLRAAGITLTVDDETVERRRRAKRGLELTGIRAAQRAAQAGMRAAAELLARAEPGASGRLYVDGAELHAETVRAALRAACAELGAPCPPDVIVASVWNGSGHEPGSGPLPSGLPIQIDLWPRDEASGCWADMTRTFVIGAPAPEHAAPIAEQERLVSEVMELTRRAARPGVTGLELFELTCDTFEAAGFATQRTGPGEHPDDGFQFSLGHGVGLEVHEAPALGLAGRSPLVSGDVIAVEPGLWDHRIGGVRFEDLLLITDDGCEVLTDHSYSLTPGG